MDDSIRKKLSDRYHLNEKGERSRAERALARSARIPLESVIIYAPPPTMNLKEADVLVKIDHDRARPLNSLQNHEVLSLQEKYGKLWKFYVFIDPEYSQRMPHLAEAATAMFGRANELELIQKGQLSMFNFPLVS